MARAWIVYGPREHLVKSLEVRVVRRHDRRRLGQAVLRRIGVAGQADQAHRFAVEQQPRFLQLDRADAKCDFSRMQLGPIRHLERRRPAVEVGMIEVPQPWLRDRHGDLGCGALTGVGMNYSNDRR